MRQAQPDKVLSHRTIIWCAVLLLLIAAGVSWPLIAIYGLGLEAIKTVGTIVLGAGGGIGLLLAARRQQTAEHDLVEKRRDLAHKEKAAADTLAHQERVSAATEADAAERRITDLYTKSVEQLGSDRAPVRLGGLYALERLAQDAASQRQTIVNVLCAYLRMPYSADKPKDDDAAREHAQEQQVRQAAQRILSVHLSPGPDPAHPAATFWCDTDLDLTGATLVDFTLRACRVGAGRFEGTNFVGKTDLGGTTFTGAVAMDHAVFTGSARFSEVTFEKTAAFRRISFGGNVRFRATKFAGYVRFIATKFDQSALFADTDFAEGVWFTDAVFSGTAKFSGALFGGMVSFVGTTFPETPRSRKATFYGAQVLTPSTARRVWPSEWTLSETDIPTRPGRRTLVWQQAPEGHLHGI